MSRARRRGDRERAGCLQRRRARDLRHARRRLRRYRAGLSPARARPAMLTDDGLHPSAAMHARWAGAAFPVASRLLAHEPTRLRWAGRARIALLPARGAGTATAGTTTTAASSSRSDPLYPGVAAALRGSDAPCSTWAAASACSRTPCAPTDWRWPTRRGQRCGQDRRRMAARPAPRDSRRCVRRRRPVARRSRRIAAASRCSMCCNTSPTPRSSGCSTPRSQCCEPGARLVIRTGIEDGSGACRAHARVRSLRQCLGLDECSAAALPARGDLRDAGC